MTTDSNTPTDAGPGHNQPPPYDADKHAELAKLMQGAVEDAAAFADLKVLDEPNAARAKTVVETIRSVRKQIEAQRQADKQVHDDRGRAVQTAYKTLDAPLEKAAKKLGDLLTAFLIEQQRIEEERKRAEMERLRKEAEDAEAKRRAAEERNDMITQAAAEAREKEIAREAERVAREKTGMVLSHVGAGKATSLRTYHEPRVVNGPLAVATLYKSYRPEFDALIERCARDAHRRGTTTIPGVEFDLRKQAV